MSRFVASTLAVVSAGMLALVLVGCGSGMVPTGAPATFPPTTLPVTQPPATPPSIIPPITPPPVTPPVTPPPVTPPVTPPPVTNPGSTFGGKVMSGASPIIGAQIQVYAAGTAGNGFSATALLSDAPITDAAGAFIIPGGYSCPSAASQLYVVARGGKIGADGSSNSAIALATILGACNQVASSSTIVVNEATTSATVWGLSQFLTTSANLGASATNTTGLANAFSTVANLVNLATGISPGASFPRTGISPAPKLNTLANLLHTCTSSVTGFTPCDKLFAATTPAGASAPTNTFDAALNLVHNPGVNVAALYTQAITSSAFSPALTKAPSDWTLFITYTGGGMKTPGNLGVDSTGSIWVTGYFGAATKFSPTGEPLTPTGVSTVGLTNSYGLAIDASDNVWIPYEQSPRSVNKGLGSVSVLNSNGQSISGATGFSSGGLNYPIAVAIDTNGNAWVVNYGNATVTLLSSSGQPLSGTNGYYTPSFAFPAAVAVDANHNAWIGDQNDDVITRISADGAHALRVSCCNGPSALAIDQHGNVWASNYYGDSVSHITGDGTVVSTGYVGGGLVHPQGSAIDGSGNVWIANYRNSSLSQFSGSASSNPGKALSPNAGWAPDASLLAAFAVAIDASGNLWITNQGNDTLTELVGLAVPVKTPLIGPPQLP